jgi:LuxR family transcriptional regulator, maltose regulon positive regulatory protein
VAIELSLAGGLTGSSALLGQSGALTGSPDWDDPLDRKRRDDWSRVSGSSMADDLRPPRARIRRAKRLFLQLSEAKLMLPRVQPGIVRRSRLLHSLDREAALTLVDAPVGYGKTMLLRSWCAEQSRPVAWITLDAADADPARLWTYVASALERVAEGVGWPAVTRLAAAGGRVELAIDQLLNGLHSYGQRLAIVFDDLHLVDSEASVRSIEHAVERLPANVRVLAATRSDPPIHLARLRAGGALNEIRASELAFRVDEARELLVGRERIELSDEDVKLLVERTEGWPAGLYLAALWLRDLADPSEGVRSFAGSHRQVADYLAGEVLQSLASETKEFLMRTSVLGRLTPELCDAVLDRQGSAEVLAELNGSNVFIVALDGRGEWFRYHHLFGELLRLELAETGLADPAELHRRAAAWYRKRGLVEDAIEHAAAAGDHGTVADLLAECAVELFQSGRVELFLSWVKQLPPELLIEHPSLPAFGVLAAGQLGRPAIELQQLMSVAERARQERPELWAPLYEAVVQVTRVAFIETDIGAAVQHASRAVTAAQADVGDTFTVAALASLSNALFFAGDLAQARSVALQAVERPEATQRPGGYVAALGLLAAIDAEEGRTASAVAWGRQAIAYARETGQAGLWPVAIAHLGLASALSRTGQLAEAEREAVRGERLRQTPQFTAAHAHALLVLAEVRAARAQVGRAASDLERARAAISKLPDPGRLPTLAARVERMLDHPPARPKHGPIEEPSPGELAVLRYLATDLSQREIGARLYLSVNTVKTHTRELYRKLGVHSRSAAVTRAAMLGLLESRHSPG